MKRLVEVILPLPLFQLFTYSVPDELEALAQPGVRVLVPFREKTLTGIVCREVQTIPEKVSVIKPLFSVLDAEPLLSPAFLNLVFEVSRSSFTPPGEIIKAALPPRLIIEEKAYYRLKKEPSAEEIRLRFKRLKPQAQQVISLLANGERKSWRYLQRKVAYSRLAFLLSRMEKLGWICREKKINLGGKRRIAASVPAEVSQLSLGFPGNSEFEAQLDQVLKGLTRQEGYRPYLLLGPRARREEFFLELIRRWKPKAQNILILFPEIAWLPTVAEKIKNVLGPQRVVLLHGELSPRLRESNWLRVLRGEADVVVGTRSAVFAPFSKLELVLVAEEGDEAYINENPYYDTRQVAWQRAKAEKATIIFSASTPSISLYSQAKEKGFLLKLNDLQLPQVRFITYPSAGGRLISPELQATIGRHLQKKGKVVIFLNRRGYASHLSCARCHTVAICPRCRRPLTLYSRKRRLVCHYCRYETPTWRKCPGCGHPVMEYRVRGLEAAVEEIKKFWPECRVESLAAESARSKDRKARIIKAFNSGHLDVLVGTQFLVPWIDWHQLLLTVIIGPEMILSQPDFRSGERVFRMIQEIREEMSGFPGRELIIQTEIPDNYVLEAAGKGDYAQFAEHELRFRRLLGLPPAKALVRVVISDPNKRAVARQTRQLRGGLEAAEAIEEYLGPSILEPTLRKQQAQIFLRGKDQEKIISFLWSQFPKSLRLPRVEIFS